MKILNLPLSHLFAIPLIFDDAGEYAGFDISADTADMNGKAVVIEKCIQILNCRIRRSLPGGTGIVVNIGDGILDANAYPSSDAFIGYTGVTHKVKALEKAMMYVSSYQDLLKILTDSE